MGDATDASPTGAVESARMPPSTEAEKVRRELLAVHGDTPETRRLAETAAAFWARAEAAHALVEQEGLLLVNRTGTFTHPAVSIEKNARLGFLTAVRALRQQPKRTKLGGPTAAERLPRTPKPSHVTRKFLTSITP